MNKLIVENGIVLTGGAVPRVVADGAVIVEEDRVVAVGPRGDVEPRPDGAVVIDARGGLVMPGWINLHHHFYSQMATGLIPDQPMHDFGQILDRFWWRLDRAHDVRSLEVSAQLAVLDCIRHGCTTVFDHHASPSSIDGCLDIIGRVIDTAGISGVLCVEVSDRNGREKARAEIEENLRFFEAHRDHDRICSMLGFHASFTLSDQTLSHAQEMAMPEMGSHIHVAEDPLDGKETRRRHGVSIINRLHRYGFLGPRTILAHGLHLTPAEWRMAGTQGAVLVMNPESNANNAVGVLDVNGVASAGLPLGLGSDGMTSSMVVSLRTGFLFHRSNAGLQETNHEVMAKMIETNARFARRFFEEPLLGVLAPGAPADLAVLDYQPATPMNADNWFGHVLFGAAHRPVRHTIGRGRILMQDFDVKTLDTQAIIGESRRLARDLWRRFGDMNSGTDFLGQGTGKRSMG